MENNEEEKAEGKSEKFFREFGKRMDQFLVEVKEASGKAQVDFQSRFEDLKKAGDNIRREAQNKDRWKEVEASLNKAGKELENAFRSAFKKKEEPKS